MKLAPGKPFEEYRHALKHLHEPHMVPMFLQHNLETMANASGEFTFDNPTGEFTPRKFQCGTMSNEERIFYPDYTLGPAWSAKLACNLRPSDLQTFVAFLAKLGIFPDTGVRVTRDAQHKNGMMRVTMGFYLPYRDWNEMATRCMLVRGHTRPKPPGVSAKDSW